MKPQSRPRRPARRPAKGAAVLEFTIGLPVLMGFFFMGIVITNMMLTRQVLTTAISQAVRACAMRPLNENMGNCVLNTARTVMGNDNGRCDGGLQVRVQVIGDPDDPNTISMLRADGRCQYRPPAWDGWFNTILNAQERTLTADAQMPRIPVR